MKSNLKLAVFLAAVFAMSTGFTWSSAPTVSPDESPTQVAIPSADLLACGGDDKDDDDDKSNGAQACGDDKDDDDDKSNGAQACGDDKDDDDDKSNGVSA